MKVVLVSLMLLLAFIAIDCRPFEKTGEKDDNEEFGEELNIRYLTWVAEQPQGSDKSFQRFLESVGTKIEQRELSDNDLDLKERLERKRKGCHVVCLVIVCYTVCSP